MRQFAYEALTASGAVSQGEMAAQSELELESQLRAQGEYLIRAEARPEPSTASTAGAPRTITDGRVPRKDLLAFTEYLWGSAQAGIPILTTLHDVESQLDSKIMRRITVELREAMTEEGKALSEALAEHPRAFSRLYIGTVEAGETTGQLDYSLQQLVDYLEWHREIALQIRQATMYPITVLVVMVGLVVLLVSYVYPRLMPVFTGFGVELPLPTLMVMAVGDFLRAQWMLLVAAIAAAFGAVALVGRTPRGRLALDTAKLRLPIFGPLIHQIEMSRVVTYMALFYRTGVDLMRGLSLLEQMVTNRRVALAIRQARGSIAGGESIAASLAHTALFPSVVIRGFALGEATGKLDESLDRARAYYAREVPAAVRRMLGALQPALVVILGGILAIIALSIFLPIVRIYQAVGQ